MPNVVCPNPACRSKDHRPNATHCAKCGSRLPDDIETMNLKSGIICPHCHNWHSKDVKFCPTTGKSLVPKSISVIPPTPPQIQIQGTLPIGSVLQSRYRVVNLLGEGGMGRTYLVADMRLNGKQWAVKEMYAGAWGDGVSAIQQFAQEAQLLAQLNHPSAVRIADFFTENGRYYLVMDFIEGKSLQNMLDQGSRISEKKVKEITLQVLDVLIYLHSRNIIFRDIKPSNIMLTPDDRVIVLDFGIARVFKPGKKADTQAFGTPVYAPPEQYGGPTDPRSDIYALGATMYVLLTGSPPPSVSQRLTNPNQSVLPKSFNSNLRLVVARAMELNPQDRFQNASEMKRALSQIQI